ncbi:hypothetical protein [Hydrogenovibrio kuenenii]|uniref:hypothetical protein n=1 Tax=Hydrogenovibrio kuenenii TaxID=63658 RepID=UPI0004641F4E|nr:hypothetical protein [Hydrogenovibrio kuenenii]
MHEEIQLTKMPKVTDRFRIENELLYQCIAHPIDVNNSIFKSNSFHSYTSTKNGLGYVFLAFIVRQALGFHRYPFLEDRILSDWRYGQFKDAFYTALDILDRQYQAIIDETLELYSFTQDILQQSGLSHVTISRAIKDKSHSYLYASHVARLCHEALNKGDNYIHVEMDILNGFASDTTYPGLLITPSVPIADILCFANIIGSANDPKVKTMEHNEWIVINRHPKGIVKIPLDAIHFKENLFDIDKIEMSLRDRRYDDDYLPVGRCTLGDRLFSYKHRDMSRKLSFKERVIEAFSYYQSLKKL